MSLPGLVNMVCDLAYSPDGGYLASADDNRRVTVFDSAGYEVRRVLPADMKVCVHCYVTVAGDRSPDIWLSSFIDLLFSWSGFNWSRMCSGNYFSFGFTTV